MSQKFCHNCGKKAEIAWKSCPFCETSFASLNERPKQQQYQQPIYNEPTVTMVGQDEDGDSNYLDSIAHYQPKIGQLEVEIEQPRMRKETLDQLSAHPTFVMPTDQRTTPPPPPSKEEFLKDFFKDASTLRRE